MTTHGRRAAAAAAAAQPHARKAAASAAASNPRIITSVREAPLPPTPPSFGAAPLLGARSAAAILERRFERRAAAAREVELGDVVTQHRAAEPLPFLESSTAAFASEIASTSLSAASPGSPPSPPDGFAEVEPVSASAPAAPRAAARRAAADAAAAGRGGGRVGHVHGRRAYRRRLLCCCSGTLPRRRSPRGVRSSAARSTRADSTASRLPLACDAFSASSPPSSPSPPRASSAVARTPRAAPSPAPVCAHLDHLRRREVARDGEVRAVRPQGVDHDRVGAREERDRLVAPPLDAVRCRGCSGPSRPRVVVAEGGWPIASVRRAAPPPRAGSDRRRRCRG